MTKEQLDQAKKEYDRLKSAPPAEKPSDKPVAPATPAAPVPAASDAGKKPVP